MASPPVRAEPRGSECCAAEDQSSVYPRRFHHSGIKTVTAARSLAFGALFLLGAGAAYADRYSDTIALFKNAGDSAGLLLEEATPMPCFRPSARAASSSAARTAKAACTCAASYTGDAAMTQLSAGFQAGGKAYSQIIFFEDKRALDEFESGLLRIFGAGRARSQ